MVGPILPPMEDIANIDRLVATYPDIPLFVLLLQNPTQTDAEYEAYIDFWFEQQAQSDHIFTYLIQDAAQIEGTYNQIIAQLQNTIPTWGLEVKPTEPLDVYVSPYVQEILITVLHQSAPQGEALALLILLGRWC